MIWVAEGKHRYSRASISFLTLTGPLFSISGRDCYILSQLVGESGRIVGVDMTDEQLATAIETISW